MKKVRVKKKSTKTRKTKSSVDPRIIKLGMRIRELRKKKGFSSYDQFAYESNISRVQVGRYESGEDMYFSSLLKIIDGLGLSVKDFFSEGID